MTFSERYEAKRLLILEKEAERKKRRRKAQLRRADRRRDGRPYRRKKRKEKKRATDLLKIVEHSMQVWDENEL